MQKKTGNNSVETVWHDPERYPQHTTEWQIRSMTLTDSKNSTSKQFNTNCQTLHAMLYKKLARYQNKAIEFTNPYIILNFHETYLNFASPRLHVTPTEN